MDESASPASPQPTLTFWGIHCRAVCSFGGWSPDPSRLEVEASRLCPYDQSARAVHLQKAIVP